MEIIRRDNGQTTQAINPFEPARVLRELLRWDPMQGMASFGNLWDRSVGFQPNVDVSETKEAYLVKADVPGIKEADLELSLHGNRLQISGKREEDKEEKTDTTYSRERYFGQFSRVLSLPDDADAEKIKADLKDGVLTVHIAKRPEAQTKRIPVKGVKS